MAAGADLGDGQEQVPDHCKWWGKSAAGWGAAVLGGRVSGQDGVRAASCLPVPLPLPLRRGGL